MPFKDLRQFISKLEAEKELCPIGEEVDWDLEAAAMLRLCYEKGLPAPLFQKARGYPAGDRMVGGILSNHKRIASSLEIDPAVHPLQLMEEYLRRKKRLIRPVLVEGGPCKENVHLGKEVNLLEFPVPFIHRGDGGRYIGTWHIVICKDPDSEWVNWGMYRAMVHDSTTLGLFTEDVQHLTTLYRQKYEARNRPMEIALAIGVEPITSICAATDIPFGVSEAEVAGGIRGQPLELVKCETVDLCVPSTAEIVIEGEILPHERKDEGPFGEYTGYAT
ncbi:MAG: UbiD family decarboxylase, partial [Chloroflexi bacterium]|nr:UbiD family decarboxylase [Chloroflexota bacterium]